MAANYTMAKDMCEMQSLNKKFVKSLDSIMKRVQESCKAIQISNTEKSFAKALDQQTKTNLELQRVLETNNIMFANSVNEVSDVDDSEIRTLLGDEIAAEEIMMDNSLDELEAMWCGDVTPRVEEQTVMT